MKKNTTKPTVSPAPATKTVAAKPAAKKKSASAAPRKKAASVAPVAAPPVKSAPAAAAPVSAAPAVAVKPAPTLVPAPAAPAPKPVAAPAPVAVRLVERRPVVTTISAKIDIGFGNTLYIRGEGPGLSWDAGVPMDCVADDLWRITLGESGAGYIFKVLVNDLTWNVGPDYTAGNGASLTVTPEF